MTVQGSHKRGDSENYELDFHIQRIKDGNIEKYKKNLESLLDMYTGEPLNEEDRKEIKGCSVIQGVCMGFYKYPQG